ncbi:MAG: hypothetical protein GY697_05670 [Desulfobacterales bacterium]|nr:hypothetical protein [Desulfobacterales bacterium]
MPTQNENKPARRNALLTTRQIIVRALIIALAIVAVWGGSYLIINQVFPDLQSASFFGSSFGAIHALFSALALAGVILVILLQTRELALQRSELESTRMEIGKQTEQFEGQKVQFESQKLQFELQNETLIQQRFENTFFHLLTLHHEIVGSIADRKTEKGEHIEIRGRAVFVDAYIPIKARYKSLQPESPENQEALEADIDLIRKQFSWFYRRFSPYFTNFFSTIEFVDQNKIGYLEVKQFYINLLRAQLSGYELMFIYYYAVTTREKNRYADLAEKYHLFADLLKNDLLDPAHTRYFQISAFTESTDS